MTEIGKQTAVIVGMEQEEVKPDATDGDAPLVEEEKNAPLSEESPSVPSKSPHESTRLHSPPRRRPPPPPPPKSDTASTSTNVEDKDVATENLTAVPSRSISQSTIRSDVATLKRTNTVAARAMSTIGVASRHKMTVSASPPRESFLEANVPHQREELLEADIMLQMKIAEDTRASLKLMEKRISKYFQTMENVVLEGMALSEILKKQRELFGKVKDQFQLGDLSAKTAEMVRYIEVLRSSMGSAVNGEGIRDTIEREYSIAKAAKKKFDEVADASDHATTKVNQTLKKGKVNLVKASEQKQERDLLNKRYTEMAPETLAILKHSNEVMTLEAMDRLEKILEGYKEFFQQGYQSLMVLSTDMELFKSHVASKRQQLEESRAKIQESVQTVLPLIAAGKSPYDSRLSLFKQFVNEECIYTQHLRDIVTIYLADIWKDATLFTEIDKDDVGTMFSNIDSIYHAHSALQEQLENTLKNYQECQNIGAIALELPNLSPLYLQYVGNFGKAVSTLHKAQHLKHFQAFLRSCASKAETDLDLFGLLSLPFKHIPKYKDYLESFIAQTNPESTEYSDLVHALESVNEIADFVTLGFSKAMASNFREQIAMYEEDDWERRYYVKDDTLVMISPPSSNKNEYHFVLFSDTLMYTKRTGSFLNKAGEKLKYCGKFDIRTLDITRLEDTETLKCACTLSIKGGDSHTLIFPNNFVRKQWMDAISNTRIEAEKFKVFGVSLEELMKSTQEETDIPPFLADLTSILAESGLTQEGLFRVSAAAKDVIALTEVINKGKKIQGKKDHHAVAGLIKQWLRNLPEPILTWEVCSHFKDMMDKESTEVVQLLKQHISTIPVHNKYVLQHLVRLFHQVAQHSDTNKMAASNLAIVLTPVLYREASDSELDASDYKKFFPIIQSLIENYDEIFSEIEKERIENQNKHKEEKMAQKKTKRHAFKMDVIETEINSPELEELYVRASVTGELTIGLGEIVKQGYLSKKGVTRRNWKTRWFVLKFKYLYYFAARKDSTPKGLIYLINARLEPLSRKEFGFTVVTGAREYYICASTAKEQQEWMDAIQQCIHEATPEELAAFEQRIQDLREAAKRNPVEIAKRLGGKFTNTLRTKGANT